MTDDLSRSDPLFRGSSSDDFFDIRRNHVTVFVICAYDESENDRVKPLLSFSLENCDVTTKLTTITCILDSLSAEEKESLKSISICCPYDETPKHINENNIYFFVNNNLSAFRGMENLDYISI